MYHKVKCGPTSYFDVDDTLVMWDIPYDYEGKLVQVNYHTFEDHLMPNIYNIELLKKFASRGHSVIVWSAGGSDWAEAVIKALNLEKYVSAVISKPNFYIDDLKDPNEFMGKHVYIDINGDKQNA